MDALLDLQVQRRQLQPLPNVWIRAAVPLNRAVFSSSLALALNSIDGRAIGVLAVQGDVREHLAALAASGARTCTVRRPSELADACAGDPVELERVRARMQPGFYVSIDREARDDHAKAVQAAIETRRVFIASRPSVAWRLRGWR